MRCPSCALANLKTVNVEKLGAQVDYCPNCNGMWFSGEQLRAAVGEAIDELALLEARRSYDIQCAECGRELQAWNFPYMEAEVGICTKCRGLWVEGRQAKQFLRAVKELKEYGVPDKYRRKDGFFEKIWKKIFS